MAEFVENSFLSNAFSGSFYKAPICRLGVYGSIGSFFVFTFPAAKFLPLLRANIANVIVKKEFWRLTLSKLFTTDLKCLFLYIILILHFKKFEKRFGSRKFAGYICSMFLLTQGLEYLFLYLSHRNSWGIQDLPNGPFAIIFSLFLPFYFDIPRIERARLLGIPISGKAFAYIFGLQLAAHSVEAVWLSVIGLISGSLYRANFLGMQRHMLIPKWLSSACSKLLSPLLGTSPPAIPRYYGATLDIQRLEEEERIEQAVLRASLRGQRRRNNGVQGSLDAWLMGGARNPVIPSEDLVLTLTNMGFSRERAEQALVAYDNDLAQATNHLLAGNG